VSHPKKKTGRLKSATVSLRVSTEFKKRLEEEAAKARRSVTNYVEVTLWDLWDKENARNR
jgi:hypothetical protein